VAAYQKPLGEVAADEARAPGDEHCHYWWLPPTE
jgi:hypothetical protein